MALTKREYKNGQTTITAENLNEIQDEVIRLDGDKAPAGYGLGRAQSASDKNIDDVTAPGWYHMTKSQTIGGVTVEYCYLHVTAWADGAIHCTQVAYLPSSGRQFTRRKQNGAWGEWVDCTPSAFAPSGYGLGAATWYSDGRSADTMQDNGWFAWGSGGVVGTPFSAGYMFVVARQNGKYVTQFAFNSNYTGTGNTQIATRTYGTTGWSEWEWVNPPLNKGVEYRTTKRWKGVPVYCRLINLGWLAAGSHSFPLEDIPITGTSMGIDIRIYNNNQEFVSENGNVTGKWLGKGSEYLTLSFTLAVAHGGIDAYIEYAK